MTSILATGRDAGARGGGGAPPYNDAARAKTVARVLLPLASQVEVPGSADRGLAFLRRAGAVAMGNCVLWDPERDILYKAGTTRKPYLRELLALLMDPTLELCACLTEEAFKEDLTGDESSDDKPRARRPRFSLLADSASATAFRKALLKSLELLPKLQSLQRGLRAALESQKQGTTSSVQAEEGQASVLRDAERLLQALPEQDAFNAYKYFRKYADQGADGVRVVVFLSRHNVLLSTAVLPAAPLVWHVPPNAVDSTEPRRSAAEPVGFYESVANQMSAETILESAIHFGADTRLLEIAAKLSGAL